MNIYIPIAYNTIDEMYERSLKGAHLEEIIIRLKNDLLQNIVFDLFKKYITLFYVQLFVKSHYVLIGLTII